MSTKDIVHDWWDMWFEPSSPDLPDDATFSEQSQCVSEDLARAAFGAIMTPAALPAFILGEKVEEWKEKDMERYRAERAASGWKPSDPPDYIRSYSGTGCLWIPVLLVVLAIPFIALYFIIAPLLPGAIERCVDFFPKGCF
jgi:hypothetical protein